MEDDAESVDLEPKIQDLHIVQIFGYDGKVMIVETLKVSFKMKNFFQEQFHSKCIQIRNIWFLQLAIKFRF